LRMWTCPTPTPLTTKKRSLIMRTKILITVLLVSLLGTILPTATVLAAPTDSGLSDICTGWLSSGSLHHTPSPWLKAALRSGRGAIAWSNGGRTVLVFYVAACSRYMIAIIRGNRFVTNYFPRRGWSYIAGVVARLRPVQVASVVEQLASSLTIFSLSPRTICTHWRGPVKPSFCGPVWY